MDVSSIIAPGSCPIADRSDRPVHVSANDRPENVDRPGTGQLLDTTSSDPDYHNAMRLTFLTSTYRDFIFTLLVFSIVDICTARPTGVVVGLALK